MITPFDAFEIYYVFENIIKNGAFAPKGKSSIFDNIFKSNQNFKHFLIFV